MRFFTCQRFQILAQGLAACFEELGGVTAKVLFDNAKTVTSDFVAGLSVLNPELVRLATHYRFTPVTAAASDPESKGKVEALVRYVKSNLVPEEGFGSLEEANEMPSMVPGGERRGARGDQGGALRAGRPGAPAAPGPGRAAGGVQRRDAQGRPSVHRPSGCGALLGPPSSAWGAGSGAGRR